MATITQTRTAMNAALSALTTANRYRFRPKNPQYPCTVIGMPDEWDTRPVEGSARTMTFPVWVGIDGKDDESTEDTFEALIESVVTTLLANPTLTGVVDSLDVQPVTNFTASISGDDRVILWCSIPVEVFA